MGDESNSGNVIAIVNCGGKGGLSLEEKAIVANARLIAAAPDLLSALELIEKMFPPGVAGQSASNVARAAIAKAKGAP